ncbi:MAG: NAD(P)-dependent oxidoreductase, partial [Acidobacteria bacterium]|nr:NAD(P)-dependent oxidoreductase [Acidobacteriota bacterium]
MADAAPPLFPAFLKLAGRAVTVVGGGPIASSKLRALLDAGARVTVVAPEVTAAIAASGADVLRRRFRASDLDGAWLAGAAGPPEVNREGAAAGEGGRLVLHAPGAPAAPPRRPRRHRDPRAVEVGGPERAAADGDAASRDTGRDLRRDDG